MMTEGRLEAFWHARRAIEARLFLLMQAARPAANKVHTGATLLFIGGTGGRRTAKGFVLISAMMAAMPALTKNLALELGPVRLNLIAAGFVATPLSASLFGDQLNARREHLRTKPILLFLILLGHDVDVHGGRFA